MADNRTHDYVDERNEGHVDTLSIDVLPAATRLLPVRFKRQTKRRASQMKATIS